MNVFHPFTRFDTTKFGEYGGVASEDSLASGFRLTELQKNRWHLQSDQNFPSIVSNSHDLSESLFTTDEQSIATLLFLIEFRRKAPT